MRRSVAEYLAEKLTDTTGKPVLEMRGIHEQDASDAAALLGAAGYVVRVLDGAAFDSKAALLDAIAAAFQFPGYFGRNWDALIDCWSDMSWLPAPGYICIILKGSALERTQEDLLDALYDAAGHIAKRWKEADEKTVFKVALLYNAIAPVVEVSPPF